MNSKQTRQIIHRDMTRVEKSVSFILFVMLVVFLYLSLPISRIQAVYVMNVGDVTQQSIIEASQVKVNQHYFETLFFSDGITHRIQEKIPKVKTVTYRLDESNQLTLSIEEHPVIAVAQINDMQQSLLKSGQFSSDYVQKYTGSVPTLVWNGSQDSLNRFANEFSKLDDAIRRQVASAVYYETDQLMTTLYMQDGNQVKVNYTEFYKKLDYYTQFVQNIGAQKGVFDLTVGIFFTPYE